MCLLKYYMYVNKSSYVIKTFNVQDCNFVNMFIISNVYFYFQETQAQWNIVLYITVGMYLFGSIFFFVFASGDVQPWALEETNVQI